MDLGLKGRTAIVTAASKGMGKACALGLAREGARIVMCARTETDLRSSADEVRAQTGAEVVAMKASYVAGVALQIDGGLVLASYSRPMKQGQMLGGEEAGLRRTPSTPQGDPD